ncbi:hypothetical protein M8C21_013386 [Ambrosia artemisiifolia]|uniref:Agenet domain-containing protein n=1 Tax=Ambrosia artemisiifolia TaxID=4212 RepID=A0AAD5GQF4_AMBAR|nr:hypothetical protein M8C21_013386 [Ambrosia artemisiifolia]
MDNPHHNNNTSTSFLTKGSVVEVTSNQDASNAAWYAATVILSPLSTPNNNHLVYVQYHNLFKSDSSSPLREYANVSYVRPAPVPDPNPPCFQLNDVVDAFYRDGWWTGVITKVVDSSNFVVSFINPPDDITFRVSELRLHQKWVAGRWVQLQSPNQVTAEWMFAVGKKVEVSFEKESLRDVWFPATVLKDLGNSTFLVEYQQPGGGDEGLLHEVTVDKHHIRPSPPYLRDKNFVLLEKVDAYHDFGWWSGVVTKKLADNRYNVYFKHTKKEQEFVHSKVRPHMEWKGGKWFNTSQGDTATRTTDNQIEQATPITGKRSPVATSVIKSKRQKNLDSNDKTLPNDETKNGDSVTKKNPSVGQSEGFDSEVSGMTDQAVGKKGDTAVRTTHSLKDNRIEQATPIIGKRSPVATSIMKSKRQKNLDNNDNTSPNNEIMNDDSVTKKKLPSVGQSEGIDSEVSGMTDLAFKKGEPAVKTAHSLVDNQIEQATSIVGKQSPVATSIMKRKPEKTLDSNDKTSPNDEIMNDDSSKKQDQPSVGQSEGTDSEVSGMTDQAFSNTENLSHGKKAHNEREKNIELKTPTADSSTKRGKLTNELKSLQALTKGSEVDSFRTRTQKLLGKKDATNFPLAMGLQCHRMTEEKMVQSLSDEKTSNVAKSDATQPDVPLAQSTVVDQEGSEEDDASVALINKRGSPTKLPALSPKTPATVDHEIGSSVSSILSGVEADQSKEVGLTKSSGTKSLDENQGPVNEQPGIAGKQNVQLNKDKLPNENTGQYLHVQRTWEKKRRSKRKGKRGKRRTISINAEPPAKVFGADSQDASKEKADGSSEKDSTTEAISRWFEGEHSPTDGPEGTVEQSSKASEGRLDFGNLTFIKSTALWKTLESMEAFRMFPQKPHFRPLLEGVLEGAQEGLAIGTMVTFSTMVDKTCNLRIDDPRSKMEDCLETIAELETNGFDVEVIRDRLTGLLLIKDKKEKLEEQSKGVVEKIEENNTQGKRIEEEIEETNRQMREMEERMKHALLKKEQRISETDTAALSFD